MINDLYREEILEHYREPLNYGRLLSFDKHSRQVNPFCGDEISIFVRFKKGVSNKVIENVGFEGKGCVVSVAGASMLTEFAKGKEKSLLTKFSEEDMLSLLGVEVSQTRKKCAFLALAVLKNCFE